MSQSEFEKRIAEILRRLAAVRAYQRGDVSLRRVQVRSYVVPEHRVRSHVRFVPTSRVVKPATRKAA